jgi:hypothetical protein
MVPHFRANACNGKKDHPGDKPDGQKHANHHAKESEEKIGVHPVCPLDLSVVRGKESQRPLEDAS